jgi:prepilin-type N-terminal cleavage/methylation domain-containing protein
MAGSLRKLASRIPGGQKGFTLIEMIVVVGIIAVLAAVIVPNIGKFIGSGEQGAKDAEFEAVQTAMNAMMANMAIITLTDHSIASGASSTNDWLNFPLMDAADPPTSPNTQVEMNLHNYLQSPATVYYYCWNLNGQLTNDSTIGGDEAPAVCP